MSLQSRWNKPGPGVEKDTPRKKGVARFLEILVRDFSSLFCCGLITGISFLPMEAGLLLGLSITSAPLALALAIAGGVIAGPFLCALYDAILRMLRDEPAFWWHTYKKALRQDWKASLLPGGLTGLTAAMISILILTEAKNVGVFTIMAVVSIIVSLMILPLWFAQIALMDLPLGSLLKNALLLAFGRAPRTLPAALVQAVYFVLVLLTISLSFLAIFYLPLISLWVTALITMQILYIPLDEAFSIEKRVAERREAEAAELED